MNSHHGYHFVVERDRDNWYEVDFHPYDEKTGIIGPTPHGPRSDANLTYFEMTSAGAMNFLGDYRDE